MSTVGQNPANVVAHRAWREAQAMLLAASSGGPRTLALLGAAGTGKTWLLGRLVTELRSRGRQVRLEQRGDVPPQLPIGAVLLVDEASRLDQASLERIANQQRGLVILADVPAFASRLDTLARPPATITLPTIDPVEVPNFVADWAAAHDFPVAITDDAVARLIVHSGGTPRLITQLAKAALALAESTGRTQIIGADIDDAAALKTGAIDPPARLPELLHLGNTPTDASPLVFSPDAPAIQETVLPETVADAAQPPPGARAIRFRWRAAALVALPATAACALAIWVGTRTLPPMTSTAPSPAPSVVTSSRVPPPIAAAPAAPTIAVVAPTGQIASAPEASPAEASTLATTSAPALVATDLPPTARQSASLPLATIASPVAASATMASPVAPSATIASPVAPSPLPPQAEAAPVLAASTPHAPPVAASALEPLATPPPPPDLVASLSAPLEPDVAAHSVPPVELAGAPGLVFLVRPGDTLATLYAQVYRGHTPPPYTAVLAANPHPLRPGAVVIFPPPLGGWNQP